MYYSKRDRRINYLSRQNTKFSNVILREMESNNPNHKVIDNCFAAIEINQTKMWKYVKQNVMRNRAISKKRKTKK